MSVGLFPLNLRTASMPGAPTLTLNLLINAPERKVTGIAHVTQATNPPVQFACHVAGEYSVMTVMPRVIHYQVKLGGVLLRDNSVNEVEGSPNPLFNGLMVLDDSWSEGTIEYAYLNHPKPVEQPIGAYQA